MSNFIHYKDFVGTVEFSEEDSVFHGKVIGVKSLISFEGDSVRSLTADYHSAVDEYLEYCLAEGLTPEKSYKGSFNVRVEPELHQCAAAVALTRGISLNAFVEDALRSAVARV